jgi:hypothetical protein
MAALIDDPRSDPEVGRSVQKESWDQAMPSPLNCANVCRRLPIVSIVDRSRIGVPSSGRGKRHGGSGAELVGGRIEVARSWPGGGSRSRRIGGKSSARCHPGLENVVALGRTDRARTHGGGDESIRRGASRPGVRSDHLGPDGDELINAQSCIRRSTSSFQRRWEQTHCLPPLGTEPEAVRALPSTQH